MRPTPDPEGLRAEASALATETLFSFDDWLAALTRISGHPGRDELLAVLLEAAVKVLAPPDETARMLLGAKAGSAVRARVSFGNSVRKLEASQGVSREELDALAEGLLRLAEGRGPETS